MASGNLQGVTIFDGSWRNIKIANNVIVTNAWHGVTVGGTDGLYVINNTVLSTNDHGTWISAGGRTGQGVLSRNVVVRNNIAMAVVKPRTPAESYVADHNVELVDPRLLFERFDAKEGAFDLHPRSKASVIVGKGSPNEAPATDIDGRPRRPSVDIGAYQAVR
jgi:hypothetical protein